MLPPVGGSSSSTSRCPCCGGAGGALGWRLPGAGLGAPVAVGLPASRGLPPSRPEGCPEALPLWASASTSGHCEVEALRESAAGCGSAAALPARVATESSSAAPPYVMLLTLPLLMLLDLLWPLLRVRLRALPTWPNACVRACARGGAF